MDKAAFRRALDTLKRRRLANEQAAAERRLLICRRLPRLSELETELRMTGAEVIGAALQSGDNCEQMLAAVRRRNLALQAERAALLTENGYDEDCLSVRYDCPYCEDSGYIGAARCSCLNACIAAEQALELSKLLDAGQANFDAFDLTLYSDVPDGDGPSPRENMGWVYDFLVEYATRFSTASENLFLNGSTGLGKTFLSACIAYAVVATGHSVVYDTAVTVLAKYELERFGRADGGDRADIARYEQCDLLIIDDLGTEFLTGFGASALYALINARLISGRKTIINSNLTMEEMRTRYSRQIMSRIEGEYMLVPFFGEDVRLLKKRRRMEL